MPDLGERQTPVAGGASVDLPGPRTDLPSSGVWRRLAEKAGQPSIAWIWTVFAAAPLLFPNEIKYSGVIAAVLIGIPFAAAWWTGQPVWPLTPLALPWIALLLMALLAATISPVPDVSRPKVAGVILGALVMRATVLGVARRRALRVTAAAYLAAGCLICGGGLLGTALKNKYLPASVTSRFPPRFQDVPGTGGFVNPNALGGTTLYFLPVVAALGLNRRKKSSDAARARRGEAEGDFHARTVRVLARAGLLLGTFVLLAVLILSQSLTAWLSAIVSLAAVVALRSWRSTAAVALLACAAGAFLVVFHGPITGGYGGVMSTQAPNGDTERSSTVEARLEIWSRALQAIQDAPLTGVGLNAFRSVVPAIYPLFLIPSDVGTVHAHDIFLQVALDVGIPGLIAYLALLFVASGLCWQVYRSTNRSDAALAAGLWGGLFATHLFGLTDAIALGAKVGVFFWWNLGLIGALHRISRVSEDVLG